MASNVLRSDREAGRPSLTVGIQDFGATQAVRPWSIANMGGTDRENLQRAIEIVRKGHKHFTADGTPLHPDFRKYGDLPLDTIRAQPFGEHVIGVSVYRRTQHTLPRYAAFEFASERSYYAGKRKRRFFPNDAYEYSGDGTGAGKVWYLDYRWFNKEYRRKQIIVRTKVQEHPEITLLKNTGKDTMDQVYGSLNKHDFILNGVKRAKGTIRFEDMDIEGIDTYNGRWWDVRYEYLYDPLTFYERDVIWVRALCSQLTPAPPSEEGCNGTSSVVVIWREIYIDKQITVVQSNGGSITYVPTYDELDFQGVFPTHDDIKGYKGLIDSNAHKPRSGGGTFAGGLF